MLSRRALPDGRLAALGATMEVHDGPLRMRTRAPVFDEIGNETKTDYKKMMKIVLDAGYRGYVGIEYEGSKISEPEGIIATRKLLERVRTELSASA